MLASGISPGDRLFAQYAHAPNALGYCGPVGSEALLAVACGEGRDVDVRQLAKQFSGAWPYQELLADLAGVPDALDARVVRGYWAGGELSSLVDKRQFGSALLERIAPQAGHYWTHLTEELLVEAAPTHAFHVLGVYPWSRLLETGHPEPLEILESCRIGWAEVLAVEEDQLLVTSRHLGYHDRRLSLLEPREGRIGYRVAGRPFVDSVSAGDTVAVHWGFACDLLTGEQAQQLEAATRWQLDAMSPRLAAART